jgi:hypothetical protein
MGLCKERSLLAVERPLWDAVVTATPNMLQSTWTEFGYSLGIVVSQRVPALKYTKVGCSQKNILGLLFVTVQLGLLYNEQIRDISLSFWIHVIRTFCITSGL